MVALFQSLIRNRRLLSALALRDVSEEYVAHGLPRAWPVVHPLLLAALYLFVFTYIFPARVNGSHPADASVYLLAGIIPWVTLTQVMGRTTVSVLNNAPIVKQMAFPLELLPLKTLAGPLLSAATMLVCLVVYAGYVTKGGLWLAYLVGLPILGIISLTFLVGLALLLACLQVFLRDLREGVSIFMSIGLFIHPILYLPDAVPPVIQPIIYMSPFTYLLLCWQDVLFFGAIERPFAWIASILLGPLILAIGAHIFLASKPHFGDFL